MDNDRLVDRLVERGVLKTERIVRAFRKVDRGNFVLPAYRKYACVDDALPHLGGQTIPQPSTVATMLELLQPKGVGLDVGTGSGYTAALMSELCKELHTVERVQELYLFAKEKLKNRKNIKIYLGDGSRGIPGRKFDCILVTAEAPRIPEELKKQLKEEGRIVMPVSGSLVLGEMRGEFRVLERLWGFVFVPLKGV